MGEVRRREDLAARINAEHRAVERAALTALEHALAAGDLLIRAKAGVKHGAWRAWVESNCACSFRTSQVYARLASRRAEVEAAKAQSPAHLSIDGALRALAAPSLPQPWAVGPEPDLTPPEGARIDPDAERGLEEEQEPGRAHQSRPGAAQRFPASARRGTLPRGGLYFRGYVTTYPWTSTGWCAPWTHPKACWSPPTTGGTCPRAGYRRSSGAMAGTRCSLSTPTTSTRCYFQEGSALQRQKEADRARDRAKRRRDCRTDEGLFDFDPLCP